MNLEWGWDNGRALLGILLIYGICWALSESRRKLPWRIILGATAIQIAFALALYGIPVLRIGLENAGVVVDQLQAAARAGTDFVFGWVGNNQAANATLVIAGDVPDDIDALVDRYFGSFPGSTRPARATHPLPKPARSSAPAGSATRSTTRQRIGRIVMAAESIVRA